MKNALLGMRGSVCCLTLCFETMTVNVNLCSSVIVGGKNLNLDNNKSHSVGHAFKLSEI